MELSATITTYLRTPVYSRIVYTGLEAAEKATNIPGASFSERLSTGSRPAPHGLLQVDSPGLMKTEAGLLGRLAFRTQDGFVVIREVLGCRPETPVVQGYGAPCWFDFAPATFSLS